MKKLESEPQNDHEWQDPLKLALFRQEVLQNILQTIKIKKQYEDMLRNTEIFRQYLERAVRASGLQSRPEINQVCDVYAKNGYPEPFLRYNAKEQFHFDGRF